MSTKDMYIAAVKANASLYESWLRDELAKLDDTAWLPEIQFAHNVSPNGSIFVPFDRNIMREMIPHLEAQGWEHREWADVDERQSVKTGNPVSQSFGKGVRSILVVYTTEMEGSRCQWKRIGTQMVEKGVFAYLCPDGEEL